MEDKYQFNILNQNNYLLSRELVAPTLSTLSPVDNATGVSVNPSLVMTFSEAVKMCGGTITIKKTSDNSTIETILANSNQCVASGSTVTISPSVTLAHETGYYVLVSPQAISDLHGNYYAGISNSTTWNFTTSDVTAPVLSGIASDSTGSTLTMTYNEALDTGSVPSTGSFTLSGTSATVSGVNVTGSTVVLTMSTNIQFGQTVLLSYTAGANPIRDIEHNNAANLTNYSVTNNVTFSPSGLSGLTGWFDVTQMPVVADGTNCANLTDFSGNSNTIPQAGSNLGGKYYNNVKNTHPVLRFNGTSQYYAGNNKKWSNFITASACTIFVVSKITILTNTNTIRGDDGVISDGLKCGIHFRTASGGKVYFANNDGTEDHAETSLASATWAIIQARHESGNIYISVDNNAEVSTASGNLSDLTAANILIPGSFHPYTGGDIGEICVFNRALDSTEITQMLSYLNTKWGVY